MMASLAPDVPISVGLRVLDQRLRDYPTSDIAAKSVVRGKVTSAYGSRVAVRRVRCGEWRKCQRPGMLRDWSRSR